MNRGELVQALAEKVRIEPEEARYVIDTMINMWKQQLKEGGRIEFRGFGSFVMKDYGSYKGRNPHTGEPVEVKTKRLPFFKCGKELKEMLNEK